MAAFCTWKEALWRWRALRVELLFSMKSYFSIKLSHDRYRNYVIIRIIFIEAKI
jgi:hypothetical protein